MPNVSPFRPLGTLKDREAIDLWNQPHGRDRFRISIHPRTTKNMLYAFRYVALFRETPLGLWALFSHNQQPRHSARNTRLLTIVPAKELRTKWPGARFAVKASDERFPPSL